MPLFTYYHTTGGHLKIAQRTLLLDQLNMATTWLPRIMGVLVVPWNSSSQVSYRTSSKPCTDGLLILFIYIGVRLMKLPSTMFGTYQPTSLTWELAFGTPSALSPWIFVGYFVHPYSSSSASSPKSLLASIYLLFTFLILLILLFVLSLVLTFSAPAMC